MDFDRKTAISVELDSLLKLEFDLFIYLDPRLNMFATTKKIIVEYWYSVWVLVNDISLIVRFLYPTYSEARMEHNIFLVFHL